MLPATLDEVIALTDRMAANPADAVQLAPTLSERIASLPPANSELMTSPRFHLNSKWSYAAIFQNVPVNGVSVPFPIRLPHDTWIRGVVSQVYPGIVLGEDPSVRLLLNREIARSYGANGRWAVTANWRVDARQGFISSGASQEIFSELALLTGDGFWTAPLDWRMQKDQTIEVTIRNQITGVIPQSPDFADGDYEIPLCVVTFLGEEITAAPGGRG